MHSRPILSILAILAIATTNCDNTSPPETPTSTYHDGIEPPMGGLKWGASHEEVVSLNGNPPDTSYHWGDRPVTILMYFTQNDSGDPEGSAGYYVHRDRGLIRVYQIYTGGEKAYELLRGIVRSFYPDDLLWNECHSEPTCAPMFDDTVSEASVWYDSVRHAAAYLMLRPPHSTIHFVLEDYSERDERLRLPASDSAPAGG